MTVINGAISAVRTFAREFAQTGLKKATKPLGGYQSIEARVCTEAQPLVYANVKGARKGDVILSVERTKGSDGMVLARDTFVSRQGKNRNW